jgi:hypothetical protein
MWEPRPLATLWASTACNRDIFTFTIPTILSKSLTQLLFWQQCPLPNPLPYSLPKTLPSLKRTPARRTNRHCLGTFKLWKLLHLPLKAYSFTIPPPTLSYLEGYTWWRVGTRQGSWFRHCATSQKVAVSIPDEVIGFFNWPNPSSRTMSLGSTQPLTEMSTRNLPGGKGRPAGA